MRKIFLAVLIFQFTFLPAQKQLNDKNNIILSTHDTLHSENANESEFANVSDYSFIIQDSPSRHFTMRQINRSYLSGYRLFARSLYSVTKNDHTADLIQLGLHSFFLMPFTHEEGHRSVLTARNIGSVSQPYFNRYGAAYVTGVTDHTLKELRDNDLPTYIRLHTGGLESDYMLTRRVETIGSFDMDDFKNYKWEYWMRKMAILQYYVMGLVKYEIDLEEEENELDRDIVGFDTYGAARHLHRPDMDFYRYTRYEDLTGHERRFVKRLGYRSLLNLVNPLMIGIGNFSINDNTRINIGLGYTMAPFGDFIDENIRIQHKGLNMELYARQFQNRENWFHGFGLGLVDMKLYNRVRADIAGHFWNQPAGFDFNTGDSFQGGAVDLDVRYFFFSERDIRLKAFSLDIGMIYKTKGFLPEELFLEKHFGMRLGASFRF